MSNKLRELQSRKANLVKDARTLTDIAASEERDMTDEELSAFDALKSKIEAASGAIDREAALISEEAQMAHVAYSAPITPSAIISVTDNREGNPTHGFHSVGEFLKTVCQAQKPGSTIDERLILGSARGATVPANFGNEGSAQDGGFLVPPQFASEIFQLSLGEDSLLPMTDNVEITGNTMAFPKDETTPWGSNGIRAYWQGEATPAASTKPVLGLSTLRLKKIDGARSRHRRAARRHQCPVELSTRKNCHLHSLEDQRIHPLWFRDWSTDGLHEQQHDSNRC
jgi:Phage capsid family.